MPEVTYVRNNEKKQVLVIVGSAMYGPFYNGQEKNYNFCPECHWRSAYVCTCKRDLK